MKLFELDVTNKRKLLNRKSYAFLLVIASLSLSGCFTMEERIKLDPLRIDQFYTTAYAGEVKRLYQKILSSPKGNRDDSVKVRLTPPKAPSFRRGERICFALHSFAGEAYRKRLSRDPADIISKRVTGFGRITIRGTNTRVSGGNIGSIGHRLIGDRGAQWDVTCVVTPNVRMLSSSWNEYYENPTRWRWINRLKPGSYTAVIKVIERPTNRTHKLKTRFEVK